MLLHPNFAVDHRHHRTKIRVGAEELVLARYLVDGDGDDTFDARTLHAIPIAADSAELLFLLVELFFGNELERFGLLRCFVGHVVLL
jgi:hypothetical protein